MEDLGPGFSVKANRRRMLKAAGLCLICMAGVWLLTFPAADRSLNWQGRISAVLLIAFLVVGGWMFSMAAYVRWLDWTRGRAKLKGSV